MNSEIILPLLIYLVLIAALSVFAVRKKREGNFLTEYFLGSRSMGGFVLAMTLTTTYISASSFIGGPVPPTNMGWAGYCWRWCRCPLSGSRWVCWGKSLPFWHASIMR